MTTQRSTVLRDLEILADYVARDPRWIDDALRNQLVRELRQPTATTLVYNVGLIVEDEDMPQIARAAARRLEALIELLTEPQLAALIAAA